MPSPGFDQDLGFSQGVEDLPAQEFIAHRSVEGLAVAILPWAAWRDVERLRTDFHQPFLHGIGDKIRGRYMAVCGLAGPGGTVRISVCGRA